MGRNDTDMLDTLNDWYDCKPHWNYNIVSRTEKPLEDVWVNILGGTTPELLQGMLPREAIGGGFTSRLLLIFTDTIGKIVDLPFLTNEEVELKTKLIHDTLELCSLVGEFKIDDQCPEFPEIWSAWRHTERERRSIKDRKFASYYGRKPATLLKLSMILSASRGSSMKVNDQDLLRAIALLEEAEVEMPGALAGMGRSTYADILPYVMKEIAFRKQCNFSHLQRKFLPEVTSRDLDSVLETLTRAKFCSLLENGRIIFNPDFDK